MLLSGILIVYCRLYADCIIIMLSVSVSVSVYLQSLHILLLLLLAAWGWPISRPPRAEAFSRPSAQPVSTQRCMRVCVCVSAQGRGVRICMCICVCKHILLFLWALSPELKRMYDVWCTYNNAVTTLPLYFIRACLCCNSIDNRLNSRLYLLNDVQFW